MHEHEIQNLYDDLFKKALSLNSRHPGCDLEWEAARAATKAYMKFKDKPLKEVKALGRKILRNNLMEQGRAAGRRAKFEEHAQYTIKKCHKPTDEKVLLREDLERELNRLREIEIELRNEGKDSRADLVKEFLSRCDEGCDTSELRPAVLGHVVRADEIKQGKITKRSAEQWACHSWASDVLPRLKR